MVYRNNPGYSTKTFWQILTFGKKWHRKNEQKKFFTQEEKLQPTGRKIQLTRYIFGPQKRSREKIFDIIIVIFILISNRWPEAYLDPPV